MKVKTNGSNLVRLLEESLELLEGEHSKHAPGSAPCPVCAFMQRVRSEGNGAGPSYELLSTRALSLHVDKLIAGSRR